MRPKRCPLVASCVDEHLLIESVLQLLCLFFPVEHCSDIVFFTCCLSPRLHCKPGLMRGQCRRRPPPSPAGGPPSSRPRERVHPERHASLTIATLNAGNYWPPPASPLAHSVCTPGEARAGVAHAPAADLLVRGAGARSCAAGISSHRFAFGGDNFLGFMLSSCATTQARDGAVATLCTAAAFNLA